MNFAEKKRIGGLLRVTFTCVCILLPNYKHYPSTYLIYISSNLNFAFCECQILCLSL